MDPLLNRRRCWLFLFRIFCRFNVLFSSVVAQGFRILALSRVNFAPFRWIDELGERSGQRANCVAHLSA